MTSEFAASFPTPVWPEPGEKFVLTPQLEGLVQRASAYLRAGYPVNLAGPSGTGKTTLALHLAAQLRQPVTLIHGDDEFGSSDLVGSDQGYRRSKLIDNFIHSVVKTEETLKTLWADNRLTTACRHGHVLIYDEFTRSRPEANNVLLERAGRAAVEPAQARPWRRGIPASPPGLSRDLHLQSPGIRRRTPQPGRLAGPADHDHHGPTTIARRKWRLPPPAAASARRWPEQIVELVHQVRKRGLCGQHPSIRAAVMIARVLAAQGLSCDPADPLVVNTCRDVLHLGKRCGKGENPASPDELPAMLEAIWGKAAGRASRLPPPSPSPAEVEEVLV